MRKLTNIFLALFLVCFVLAGCSQQNKADSTKESKQTDSPPSTTGSKEQTLKQYKTDADAGKLSGIEFSLGASRAEIEKAWGKPDNSEENGFPYKEKQLVVYYDETNKLDQIESSSSSLAGITLKDVETALGKSSGQEEDEGILNLYYRGSKYDLGFTFEGDTDNAKLTSVTVGTKPKPDPDQAGK
jgi:hypothetical protein